MATSDPRAVSGRHHRKDCDDSGHCLHPAPRHRLALASRYNLSAGLLLRWNLLYGLLMYAVACLMMGGFIALHG